MPGEFDEKVGGVLRFNQENGAQLNLFSALDERTDDLVDFDKIFGISTEGVQITLSNILRVNYSEKRARGGEIMPTELTGNQVLVGKHFDGEPEFDNLRIEFPLLYEWADKTGIELEMEVDDETGKSTETIEYTAPDVNTADLDEFDLELVFKASLASESGLQEVREDAFFLISPDEGTYSVPDAMEFMRILRSFINLALSENIQPAAIKGQIVPKPDDPNERGAPPIDIDVLSPLSGDMTESPELQPNAENFLFTDIEDRFTHLMGRWFDRYNDLEPVISLYFGTKYNSGLYVQNVFLSLARAIESYHRIEYDGTYLSEGEFQEYYD